MPADPNDDQRLQSGGGEEALIAEFWAPLAAGYAGAYGLKDDCASIAVAPGEELVVTTDALIEGVHFFPGDDPGSVAWKALAVNVSDLVAKGATPVAYVMGMALPAFDRDWLAAFTAGLGAAQEAFGCQLIGGDTDRTPGPLSVSITAFGTCPAGQLVRRSTARTGDYVYVSGTIGNAALGLALRVDPDLQRRAGLDDEAARYLDWKFSRPRPPFALASALRRYATASIDISDGLIKDFDRLCRASGVSGRIDAEYVPMGLPARIVLRSGSKSVVDLMSGGEDYEVLATVAPDHSEVFERVSAQSGCLVARIGIVTDGPPGGIAIDEAGEPLAFSRLGWDHFQTPDVT